MDERDFDEHAHDDPISLPWFLGGLIVLGAGCIVAGMLVISAGGAVVDAVLRVLGW